MSAMTSSAPSPVRDNDVFLRGRLAAVAEFRDLPSGDVLAVFRLTVARPSGDRARVDSIECASLKPRVHRSLGRAAAGDELEVRGALHRRFWRSPAGPASRYAVDVETVRLSRTDRRGGASRARKQASA
jgi:single-strand DNA-binding protein